MLYRNDGGEAKPGGKQRSGWLRRAGRDERLCIATGFRQARVGCVHKNVEAEGVQ